MDVKMKGQELKGQKGGMTAAIIGLIGAAVVVAIMIFAFRPLFNAQEDGVPKRTGDEIRAIQRHARDFVDAVVEGRFDDAWSATSQTYRTQASRDAFTSALQSNGRLDNVQLVELKQFRAREDGGRVTFRIESDAGLIDAAVIVVEEAGNGGWGVSALALAGEPALPKT